MGSSVASGARWIGAAVGIAVSVADIAVAMVIGVSFSMNGRDVTWAIWLYLAGSLGAVGFLIGSLFDGRQRERADREALAGMRARVAEKDKLAALGQMAATVAHEVRNPLAIIRSSIQNTSEVISEPEGLEGCELATSEIDRLGRVLDTLLGYAGLPQLVARPIDARAFVERTALLAAPLLQPRGQTLEVTGAVPAPSFEGDADLLHQLLLGLIDNAARVHPAGTPITLAFDGTTGTGTVALSVADRGPGVPEPLRERIFEPLFTTRQGGSGLGLAVARQIAELHGGRLEVTGRDGGGAVFRLSLPAPGAP